MNKQMEKIRILLKMIWYNRKNYILYLVCNIFIIAFFQAFLSIGENESFMSADKIDPMISSNIFAPTVLTALFMILFVPYVYEAFLKSRKQEYAVLITLGVTQYEVICNMLLECLIISIVSFCAGIVTGSVLSVFFFFYLHNVIGLRSMKWTLHLGAYVSVGKVYALVVIIILLLNIVRFLHAEILELFNARYKEEKGKKGSNIFLLLGILLIIVAVIVMLYAYNFEKTYIWFISTGIIITGIGIMLANFDCIFMKIRSVKWKISLSFVLQYIKSWRMVSFIAAILFISAIFFTAHCGVTYQNFTRNALTYSPYDLFYVQYNDINNMEQKEIMQTLDKYDITITEEKRLGLLRNSFCNIISADDVNKKYGCTYEVEPGYFIQLFQFDINDGYEHDFQANKQITIGLGNHEKMHLKLQGKSNKILMNSCRSLADITLIVNEQDFMKIRNHSNDCIYETAVMFNFSQWKDSGNAMQELQEKMSRMNELPMEDQSAYMLSSKIETYSVAKQSSEVLTFLLLFVDILFLVAANICIFYKIKSELKEEKHIIYKLYRVGITDQELWKILFEKNICYYFVSLIIAIFIGVFYSYSVNAIYDYGKIGIICGMGVSGIIMFMQFVVIWEITKFETKR